jgi:hypothetical protein
MRLNNALCFDGPEYDQGKRLGVWKEIINQDRAG